MRETEGGSDETGSNKVTVSSWSRSCRTWTSSNDGIFRGILALFGPRISHVS